MLLTNCSSITVPSDYVYKEVETRNFTIVTWQKITNPQGVYKIYIEGDGYAFNSHGKATQDPTPRGTLVRELALGDNSPNVVYIARPCQYIKSPICSKRHWTTARFAPEIINAEYETIRQIAGNNPVVLVGFSGGAQVAGLVATAKRGLNVKKIITIAGNLDHLAWTQYHNLPPLNESMNLESYRTQFAKLPQIHYVGRNDEGSLSENILSLLSKYYELSNKDYYVDIYIFRGLITCGCCGHKVFSDYSAKRNRYIYLRCYHCKNSSVNENIILQQLEEELFSKISFSNQTIKHLQASLNKQFDEKKIKDTELKETILKIVGILGNLSLFMQQSDNKAKNILLGLLLSDCILKDKRLTYIINKPFNYLLACPDHKKWKDLIIKHLKDFKDRMFMIRKL